MRKALLTVLLLASPLVAEAQFPGEFIYPRGYRSSDGLVFDIVDATNAALRVNCVAGNGCNGTGDVTSDNLNGMFRVAGIFGARENTKVATTTPYAYAFAPAPAPAPPQFPGTFGYLRGYTDADGVFGILDSTNAAVRINCVAGCAAAGITIGSTAITGGATTQVLFNLGGVVSSDADFTFATDTLTVTKIAATTWTGNLTMANSTALITAGSDFGGLYLGTQATTNNGVVISTTNTPDTGRLIVGSTSEAWHITESADASFDFNNGSCGTSACTDPALIIHSHNQDTMEWLQLSHDGGAGVIQAGNSTAKAAEYKFGKTVALTEAGAAETVLTIVSATTNTFGLDLFYTVTATDATNRATRRGSLKLVCDNAAGTMTCTKDATVQTDDESVAIVTGGVTLTYAIATNVGTANTVILTFDIDSTMVVSAASINMTIIMNGTWTSIS